VGQVLRKEFRLRKDKEFKRVYRWGKKYLNNYFVLYQISNGLKTNRFGFTVSKKVGKAVERNYLKRRLREICHRQNSQLVTGFDLVIIPRKPAKRADFPKLNEKLRQLFERANLIHKEVDG
jgi:ribonuclease P protein component